MITNKSNTNKLITNKKRLLTKTTTNKVSGALPILLQNNV
jgi:hypothetical protein